MSSYSNSKTPGDNCCLWYWTERRWHYGCGIWQAKSWKCLPIKNIWKQKPFELLKTSLNQFCFNFKEIKIGIFFFDVDIPEKINFFNFKVFWKRLCESYHSSSSILQYYWYCKYNLKGIVGIFKVFLHI